MLVEETHAGRDIARTIQNDRVENGDEKNPDFEAMLSRMCLKMCDHRI
jgi:hypothetical protein